MPEDGADRGWRIRSAVLVVTLVAVVFWIVEKRSQPPLAPPVTLPYTPPDVPAAVPDSR